jgi:hypothetical protein
MWLIRCRLKIYSKVTETLMELECQGKCVSRSINVEAIDQMYDVVIKYIEDSKGGFFRIILRSVS